MLNRIFERIVLYLIIVNFSYSKYFGKKKIVVSVGKTEAKKGDYPYQVSVQQIKYPGETVCSGCIQNERSVITAANCLYGETIREMFYAVVGFSSLKDKDAFYHKINRCVFHPRFNYTNFENNLAIIFIEDTFTYSEFVRPVSYAIIPTELYLGCVATTWNMRTTVNLIAMNLPVCKKKHCKERFNTIQFRSHICAGGWDNYSCFQDKGTPLVCENVLFGILSVSCTSYDFKPYSFYTDIFQYGDWLAENISIKYSGSMFQLIFSVLLGLFKLFICTP